MVSELGNANKTFIHGHVCTRIALLHHTFEVEGAVEMRSLDFLISNLHFLRLTYWKDRMDILCEPR